MDKETGRGARRVAVGAMPWLAGLTLAPALRPGNVPEIRALRGACPRALVHRHRARERRCRPGTAQPGRRRRTCRYRRRAAAQVAVHSRSSGGASASSMAGPSPRSPWPGCRSKRRSGPPAGPGPATAGPTSAQPPAARTLRCTAHPSRSTRSSRPQAAAMSAPQPGGVRPRYAPNDVVPVALFGSENAGREAQPVVALQV